MLHRSSSFLIVAALSGCAATMSARAAANAAATASAPAPVAAALAAQTPPGSTPPFVAPPAKTDPPASDDPGASPHQEELKVPRRVEATTGMVADLASFVLGRGWSVRAIMGPGVDPHLYKPLRDDVVRILQADLTVTSGLMLEGKMGEVLTRAGRERWVIAIGDGLDPSRVIRHEGAEGHPDPHVWMDPTLWAQGAEAFAETIARREPDHADLYRKRAKEYADELRTFDTWAKEMFATVPKEQRILITSHDAFSYLGRAYGLRVEGVQGISTDSEPGLRRIGELVELVVKNKVPAVFVESSVPRKSIEALIEGAQARGHDLKIGGELYSDAFGQEKTWEGTVVGMLDRNVTTIVNALGGHAPVKGWKGRLRNRDMASQEGDVTPPKDAPPQTPPAKKPAGSP